MSEMSKKPLSLLSPRMNLGPGGSPAPSPSSASDPLVQKAVATTTQISDINAKSLVIFAPIIKGFLSESSSVFPCFFGQPPDRPLTIQRESGPRSDSIFGNSAQESGSAPRREAVHPLVSRSDRTYRVRIFSRVRRAFS